jgi:ferredoxin, 2Fe-2S
MARIVIANWAEKTLEVTDLSKTLLRHLHDNNLDWMHSCGGKGRCTTCKVIIINGTQNFQPFTAAEESYLRTGALGHSERLSCQTRITGDVVVAVPKEYQFPHIDYSKP